MTPMPGYCLVRKPELAESYPGSRIIVPASVQDRVARNQYEVVAVSEWGTRCEEAGEECHRWHDWNMLVTPAVAFHAPPLIKPGDWIVTAPRSLAEIPGESELWVVPIDNLLCVLEEI